MSADDDLLVAYAVGALGPAERAAVEARIAAEPALAQRVQAHRAADLALRRTLAAAFDPVLDEPLPERLLSALRSPSRPSARTAPPAPDATARAAAPRRAAGWRARLAAVLAPPGAGPRRAVAWPQAAGLAACALVAGVLLGRGGPADDGTALGLPVAPTVLAQALTQQLAAEPAAGGPVRVGLSFVARDGHYCRSFSVTGAAPGAGLACREGDSWQVRAWARQHAPAGPAASDTLRMAASPLPPAVLAAIDADIQGEALDAAAERAARASGWRR